MKVLKNQSFSAKKDVIDKLIENPALLKVLTNPFYLSLYAASLSRIDCTNYQPTERDINKYMILKEHFLACTSLHSEEMREMGLATKEALPNLRRMAFEYYHNDM